MKTKSHAQVSEAEALIQGELEASVFPDKRLGKRLGIILDQFVDGTAESVPLACQDWSNTKAAYRFFANEQVTEEDILAWHSLAQHARALRRGRRHAARAARHHATLLPA